jgi:hypothetical protein
MNALPYTYLLNALTAFDISFNSACLFYEAVSEVDYAGRLSLPYAL